jgi:hypothetical protein
LTKAALNELKAFKTPPKRCGDVLGIISGFLANAKKPHNWPTVQKALASPVDFMHSIKSLNPDRLSTNQLMILQNYGEDPTSVTSDID